jgi:hypothetical protein
MKVGNVRVREEGIAWEKESEVPHRLAVLLSTQTCAAIQSLSVASLFFFKILSLGARK